MGAGVQQYGFISVEYGDAQIGYTYSVDRIWPYFKPVDCRIKSHFLLVDCIEDKKVNCRLYSGNFWNSVACSVEVIFLKL